MMNNPARVLLIEDNPGDARLVKEALMEAGGGTLFQLNWTKDLTKGLAHLKKNPVDAILLDLTLPDSTGLATFEEVHRQVPQTAIILLTGLQDEEQAVKALNGGAQDYLYKGKANGELLAHSIRYAIERKQAEEKVLASEVRYHRLFDAARDGILILDAETGTIEDVNPFLLDMLGFSLEELRGKKVWELGFFKDIAANKANFRKLQQKEYVRYENLPMETASGRRFEVEFISNVYEENSRRVIQCNIRDITERRLAEQARHDSEERYRSLFEDSPISLWQEDFSSVKLCIQDLSEQGVSDFRAYFESHPEQVASCKGHIKVVDVNQTTLKLFGAKNKTDIFNNLGLILGESNESLKEELINIADGKTDFEWQGFNYTLTGDQRVFTLHWSAAPGHEDTLDKVLLSMNDVTELKRKEEEIRILSKIPDESPNPIMRTSADGILLYANPTSALLLAMWKTQVGRDLPDDWREKIKKVFHSGLYQEVEVQCGEKIYSLILAPIMDAGYVNLYGRDITQRKQAEEALARQTEELQERNKELDRLYHASGSLLSSAPFDLQNLARTIVEVVQQEFGQANCSVFLIRKNSNDLDRLAVVGPYAGQVSKTVLTVNGAGLIQQALRSGLVNNTPDVRAIPAYVPAWEAARAELTIPLKVENQVIGAIDVQSSEPGAFTPDDERLMTIFAERAALALERGRLNEELERRLQQLTSLRTIDMAISSSMDMNLTLGILLDQVTKQLSIHATDVLVFNPTSQSFRYLTGQGFRTRALHHTDLRLGDGYAGRAARERQMIIIQDLAKNTGELRRSDDFSHEGFVTYLGVPLIAKGQVKGVLEIFHRSPFDLNPEQRTFLEMLAGQAAIAIDSAQLFENLQGSNSELMLAYDETIEGWSRAMDLRDKETEGHTKRVTELTLRLANSMGFGGEELVHIRRGTLLHDIGKMGVPDDILRKPGALSEEEWVIMRKHPQLAYDMLASIIYLRRAIDIPYCHHEKWDGTGYPRGLKGEQIPLAARIFAVVDVWDALSSDRPYRKAWPEDKVRSYIQEQAGKHFDPHIVDIFLKEVSHVQ